MRRKTQRADGRTQILFILHQASLTGAPIILCELAWALLRDGQFAARFLIMQDGPLTSRCRSIAETDIWLIEKRERQFERWGFSGKLVSRLYYAWRHRKILRSIAHTDLVISNTIANGAILDRLSFMGCPVISYIHELPFAIRSVTTPESLKQVLKHSRFFLAGSEAVRSNLVNGLKVDRQVTEVLYSSLATRWFTEEFTRTWRQRFRMDHMIAEDALIVGVSCSAEWRKGFDWWLPVVRIFHARFPGRKVVFVWKGYRGNVDSLYADLFDARKTGLDDSVIVLPHDGDSKQTMAAFDIHLLLSREDPYPLVVLEAACMSIPTVCFVDAGGAPEFVEEDAGICVPYGDLSAMADALNLLVTDPALRSSLGECAREKVLSRHDVGLAATQLSQVIRAVLESTQAVDGPVVLSGPVASVNTEVFA
jgi:glycosyltransferase involved in cell wall biosynthesis